MNKELETVEFIGMKCYLRDQGHACTIRDVLRTDNCSLMLARSSLYLKQVGARVR